ncbi:MAG: 1-deoxy-D-xylulose-5-phosphate reductoisomerase [Acholeplasmataceae bacterium]
MKHIYILGTTGTIGIQALDVIRQHKDKFKVVGLSLGHTKENQHLSIIREFSPLIVHLREGLDLEKYQKLFPNIQFFYGDSGLIEFVKYDKKGYVLNGISGSSGLLPTIEAIKTGKDILLANKETLVMGGSLINALVKKHNVELIPIDSEHSAILGCLRGESLNEVESITITASGGSFRDLTREELKQVTLTDALNHPNWDMGPKITIDSATMMNKGLEVIEAHYLFNLPYDKIHTTLHKESIVHGMVTFKDGSVKAVLSNPDMRMPILYALAYPNHLDLAIKPLEFNNLDLSFRLLDLERFPLLKYAYIVGRKAGLYPTVYNAANEACVELFISKKITFLDIERIVIEMVEGFDQDIKNPTLEQIIQTDKDIKRKVYNYV